MEGLALVVGAGGIGRQIAEDLASKENNIEVILCGIKNVFKKAISKVDNTIKINF